MTLESYKTVFIVALIILAVVFVLPKLIALIIPVFVGVVIGYFLRGRLDNSDDL